VFDVRSWFNLLSASLRQVNFDFPNKRSAVLKPFSRLTSRVYEEYLVGAPSGVMQEIWYGLGRPIPGTTRSGPTTTEGYYHLWL